MSPTPSSVWESYPEEGRNRYIKAIAALASLTPLFKQKENANNSHESFIPYVTSKYQEVAFATFLRGRVVDIGNTPYDIQLENPFTGLQDFIGIKTFGYESENFQKVMQLKSDATRMGWNGLIEEQKYLELINNISEVRNNKLNSSLNALLGVSSDGNMKTPGAIIYHYLAPARNKKIFIGETTYDSIDLNSLELCNVNTRGNNRVTSISFKDRNKMYRYTPADSSLKMQFNHRFRRKTGPEIIGEFTVDYLDNPYRALFELLEFGGLDSAGGIGIEQRSSIQECAVFPLIAMKDDNLHGIRRGEVPASSGINAGFAAPRNNGNSPRPGNEIEIIIKDPMKFYREHPNFFGFAVSNVEEARRLTKEQRTFKLYCGNAVMPFTCYVSGSGLKNIRSSGKLEIIGKWIREDIMGLGPNVRVTAEILKEVGFDGYRFTKIGPGEVRLEVIKITSKDLPYIWPPVPELLEGLIEIPDSE